MLLPNHKSQVTSHNYAAPRLSCSSFKHWAKFSLLLIVSLIFTLVTPLISYSQQSVTELRGVWLTNIDSEVLFSSQNTASAIDTLAGLNFNTLYPTIWNWGYTLYPSKIAERATGHRLDPAEGLQQRDLLQEITQQGHQKSMAVIPWFEFGFMAPADSALAKRHQDWLTQRRDSSTVWWEGKAHQRVWLNPLHPDVQTFITDLIVEIISDYEVDGIQLDDHFGYPSDFGYDEFTVNLYQQEHNGNSPPADPKNEEWVRWRADKITAYMQQLVKTIREKKPKAIISLSPNPQAFSLESFLLDWYRWVQIGLVDELVLQVYRTQLASFLNELAQPEVLATRQHIPVGIGVLSGLKNLPVSSKQIETQVEMVRRWGFDGVSFFFYESLWNLAQESSEQRLSALKTLFPSAAQRPLAQRL